MPGNTVQAEQQKNDPDVCVLVYKQAEEGPHEQNADLDRGGRIACPFLEFRDANSLPYRHEHLAAFAVVVVAVESLVTGSASDTLFQGLLEGVVLVCLVLSHLVKRYQHWEETDGEYEDYDQKGLLQWFSEPNQAACQDQYDERCRDRDA